MECRQSRLETIIASMHRRIPLVALAAVIGASGCSLTNEEPRKTPTQPAAPTSVAPKSAPTKAASSSDHALQEVVLREERGQTTLLVKFAQPVTQYRHFTLPQPARIVVDILEVDKVTASADSYRIDTNWVSALRLNASDNNLRIIAELSGATVPPYTITPENGGLKIVVGAVDPNVSARRDAILVKGGKRVDYRANETSQSAGEMKSETVAGAAPAKKYIGQKISLEFKDADIKNVFRLLAEVSGKNIIVTDDVNRKVTIRLTEVPWDQAMELLIDTHGLGKDEVGNVIRISTAGRLKSERDALLAAKNAQDDLEPLQTAYFTLNYATAKELEPKAKPLLSKRGNITSDDRSNTLMIRDIKKSLDDVTTLISKLDTRTPQVLIESNLIETTPSFARALGMEIDSVFNGRIIASSRFLAGNPYSGSPNTTAPPFPVPSTGFKFGYLPANINAFLTAAENEGNVKIISRPSVVTLNNVPSTIRSQRILRIALPSSTNIASGSGAAAGTAVATEKVPVGIELSVKPQVSSDGFVLMNIKVKSSSIANSPTVSGGTVGVVPFDELNREAEANVLVRDGETIVIGGILKDTAQESDSGVPYLKDIPVFGWLFKNHRWQKDFEELVVFITPRIANAGSENLPSADQLWREQMKKTQGEQAAAAPANP